MDILKEGTITVGRDGGVTISGFQVKDGDLDDLRCVAVERLERAVLNHGWNDPPWRRAALLPDRTRRAIRDRRRAGEAAEAIAQDYGVRVEFVEFLAAWQLSEDES